MKCQGMLNTRNVQRLGISVIIKEISQYVPEMRLFSLYLLQVIALGSKGGFKGTVKHIQVLKILLTELFIQPLYTGFVVKFSIIISGRNSH